MSHLICKKHKRRVQVSRYIVRTLVGDGEVLRILHRSDPSRCDSQELMTDGQSFYPWVGIVTFGDVADRKPIVASNVYLKKLREELEKTPYEDLIRGIFQSH